MSKTIAPPWGIIKVLVVNVLTGSFLDIMRNCKSRILSNNNLRLLIFSINWYHWNREADSTSRILFRKKALIKLVSLIWGTIVMKSTAWIHTNRRRLSQTWKVFKYHDRLHFVCLKECFSIFFNIYNFTIVNLDKFSRANLREYFRNTLSFSLLLGLNEALLV